MRFPVVNQEMSSLVLEIYDKGRSGWGEVFSFQLSVFSVQRSGASWGGLGLGTWGLGGSKLDVNL
jgi:hypothetical protein